MVLLITLSVFSWGKCFPYSVRCSRMSLGIFQGPSEKSKNDSSWGIRQSHCFKESAHRLLTNYKGEKCFFTIEEYDRPILIKRLKLRAPVTGQNDIMHFLIRNSVME